MNHMHQPGLLQRVPIHLSHLLVPFLFILFRLTTASIEYPIGQTFELDPDEGINLIKSLLYLDGFSLYTDIWSDQPPLFTVLLSGWLAIFGQSVVAARSLILGFAALLVWSFYSTLRLSLGVLSACIGTLILINTYSFMRLSVSVMIGIPALALTMLAVYLLCLSRQRQRLYWVIASGICFALSLQTKLFSVFLIPILLLSLLINLQPKSESISETLPRRLLNSLIWLLSLGLTYFLLGLLLNSIHYEQIVSTHFGAQYNENFTQTAEALTQKNYSFLNLIKPAIRQDFLYYGLAILGSIALVKEKRWAGLLPLAWLLTACLLLSRHTPVWYHHYLLISIPLSWLCAYSVASLFDWVKFLRSRSQSSHGLRFGRSLISDKPIAAVTGSMAAFLLIAGAALESYSFARFLRSASKPSERSGHFKVLTFVLQHKSHTRWMFTDRPMYAVYAGQRVPPEIAVLSFKRVLTEHINYDTLLEVLKKYQPEQIVLARYRDQLSTHPAMSQYIQQHYHMVYGGSTAEADYFLRNDQLK